ncbi:MAG: creatininase family protein [Deltaproteobacteria bacterium]|jgi:creatinine amidohydrolase/Fe(II)-dependent formamide hydrolase-like protein|nr:creatininase family protein [Deltaproteobacteria bacterium]MBW2534801.1 creatininase family protein [Deltaproteobacteria bacterium]
MPRKSHPLRSLCVLRRLEVGPIRLEPTRLVAPYTVIAGGERSETELIYRYEEEVFDPGDPVSQNLAAMIAAQVALNYGLFCREIVFHGPYDRHDRKLLGEMAENTAREIAVKKIFQENPFLTGAARQLPATKLERYSQARLLFGGAADQPPPRRTAGSTPAGRQRYAVLSSGGKDSLLSHALLAELGLETHPIFVNESGRHWHTALNAYRHFDAAVDRTARVWTNADRLFSWMLRHLPFIRQDFAQVRADEYPVRLWTVAVFLFGALPLIRRRGVGRVLVGDEFDTSVRKTHEGIPHYDGLYDQSRYFDRAMSRYYRRKGWALSQFSILRPLSELLIEKILVERYPDLQALQMSCHATHVDGDRVLPCGRCEKCRRIIGMLTALDADPKRMGYTDEQVAEGLTAVAARGVHQETAGAEQLMHMLQGRRALPSSVALATPSRARPEVLCLRFDRDRSPPDVMPRGLREPLYRIMLEHAQGAKRRIGRQWVPIDPFSDELLAPPFPSEAVQDEPATAVLEKAPADGPTASAGAAGQATPKRPYLLGELSWPEAKERFREVDVALLPVGAIEQHGPHLPLDTDAFDAEHLAVEVAAACTEPQPLVLPLVPYGVSYHHSDFAGTISIMNGTLSTLVYDIGMSAARNGVSKLCIVNGHGGNTPALQFAAQLINRDARIFTCVDSGETSDADIDEFCETPNDVHAGEVETSTSLVTRPHLVDMALAKRLVPRFSSQYLDFTAKRRVEWYARTAKISKSGVLGDPTKANVDKGRRIWTLMVHHLVELVEDLKRMSLDEIYDRRY